MNELQAPPLGYGILNFDDSRARQQVLTGTDALMGRQHTQASRQASKCPRRVPSTNTCTGGQARA